MNDPNQPADPQGEAFPRRKTGHPVIATVVAAFVALLGSLPGRGTSLATEGLADRLGYIAGGAVFGVILWAIAYAITIRRASRRWKIGSFILLVLLGTLTAGEVQILGYFFGSSAGSKNSADRFATLASQIVDKPNPSPAAVEAIKVATRKK